MQIVKTILYQLLKPFATKTAKVCCIIAIPLLVSNLVLSAQPPSREYQLKAVFLFNFTQFVDWPASSFSTDQAPLVIGILGENPFGAYLEEAVSGEKINGHPVTVHYYNSAEEIKNCHILFVNLDQAKDYKQVIAALRGKSTLMVSDKSDFLKYGGMIRFFTKDNKIKLQINPETSKEANLVFSSKLLRLADIYVSKTKS